MKRNVLRLLDSVLLQRSVGIALSVCLVGSVVAGVLEPANTLTPGKQAKQPRMLGKKAVMHVYSCAPETLEITSVSSHFFDDVDACESAVGGALRSAMSHVREGDLVDAQCVAIDPREAKTQSEQTHLPAEVTEL